MATVIFRDFEWDDAKAAANLEKHGISFEEATSVFLDVDLLVLPDEAHDDRYVALGLSQLARLLFVVHVERGERVRIISARCATRREERTYDDRTKEP